MPEDYEGHPQRRDFPIGGEPVMFTRDEAKWLERARVSRRPTESPTLSEYRRARAEHHASARRGAARGRRGPARRATSC